MMSALILALLPFPLEIRFLIALLTWAPIGSLSTVFTLWAHGNYGLSGLINALSIMPSVLAMSALVMIMQLYI